jgi:cytochrome c biogenesis protein CcmG/thiol:disulfide interchange protein DsbE
VRRVLYLIAAAALVAVVIVGLGQAGGDATSENDAPAFDLEAAARQLDDAPAPLAALYAQPNALLSDGFDRALDDLEGHPIVVNKWASWCRPCRAEFPIFQQVAASRGTEVGFLGLNAEDKRPAAEKFLSERPLPYPSYEDPDETIARDLRAAKFFPMTIFIDARGRTEFVKAGEYTSAAELEADIDKYL